MKRLALALCVMVVVVSSCGIGVRKPASDITETSATLNGNAVSTMGGPGSYFFDWGPAENEERPTPVRNIDFGTGREVPISVPVTGLEPGTTYRYQACAGDAENPGGGRCSRTQTFKTAGTGVRALRTKNFCSDPGDFAQEAIALNFEPSTAYGFRIQFVEGAGGSGATFFTTDDAGNYGIGNATLRAPFRVRIVIRLNPNLDAVKDPGEATVLDKIYGADEPCTDAQPEEPTLSARGRAGSAPRAVFTPSDG
jgi:hypothetical protein